MSDITFSPAVRYTRNGNVALDICATEDLAREVALPEHLAEGYADAVCVTVVVVPLGPYECNVYDVTCNFCGSDRLGITRVRADGEDGAFLACPICRDSRQLPEYLGVCRYSAAHTMKSIPATTSRAMPTAGPSGVVAMCDACASFYDRAKGK